MLFVDGGKWDAWNRCLGMTAEEAELGYVYALDEIRPAWRAELPSASKPSAPASPSVATVAPSEPSSSSSSSSPSSPSSKAVARAVALALEVLQQQPTETPRECALQEQVSESVSHKEDPV